MFNFLSFLMSLLQSIPFKLSYLQAESLMQVQNNFIFLK